MVLNGAVDTSQCAFIPGSGLVHNAV